MLVIDFGGNNNSGNSDEVEMEGREHGWDGARQKRGGRGGETVTEVGD